jgi:hypothetical protein
MTRDIRIVVPFLPLPPESDLHLSLGDFDWLLALRQVVHSAQVTCACPVHAITDQSANLPVPALRYATVERRLMLWTLEACACYLESADFDRDTVMLDVDQLVFKNLAAYFPVGGDLGLLMRHTVKHVDGGEPLLNGVQFWSHAAKSRLGPFYRDVLARAKALPEDVIRWGADTVALREHVAPMMLGVTRRSGLDLACVNALSVLEPWSREHGAYLESTGRLLGPSRPIYDFRYLRKAWMPRVFEVGFGVLP